MFLQAADVYAYGVLLCEVLTRRPVWEGLRHPQIIHAIGCSEKAPRTARLCASTLQGMLVFSTSLYKGHLAGEQPLAQVI